MKSANSYFVFIGKNLRCEVDADYGSTPYCIPAIVLRPHLRIRFELNKLPIHLNRNYSARIRSLLNYALAMSLLYYYESIQTAANNSIDCLKPTGEGVRQPYGHDGFHEKIALIC